MGDFNFFLYLFFSFAFFQFYKDHTTLPAQASKTVLVQLLTMCRRPLQNLKMKPSNWNFTTFTVWVSLNILLVDTQYRAWKMITSFLLTSRSTRSRTTHAPWLSAHKSVELRQKSIESVQPNGWRGRNSQNHTEYPWETYPCGQGTRELSGSEMLSLETWAFKRFVLCLRSNTPAAQLARTKLRMQETGTGEACSSSHLLCTQVHVNLWII